ncbi:MAG: hypothetical protein U1E78_11550 [Gammaproteobacteria bacterium]
MSEFSKGFEDELELITGLDDLELQLLEYTDGFDFVQAKQMGTLLLNPLHLDIWVNAKPDTLH